MTEPWPEVPLTAVADLVRGVSYPKTDSRDEPAAGYVPVLRATNIQDARLVLGRELVYVAESNISPEQRLRPGDIVVATSSGSKHLVGKSALLHAQWSGSFGAFCAGIRPKPNIESRYLAYFLQSPRYWKEIGKKALGVNINNLRRGDLETLSLPLPPAEAQREIVAEIEKQFSRLDEAVANLQRVKTNLRRYRASVLSDAFGGRRSGSDDASSDPTNFELPEGWIWRTYAEIGEVTTGFTPSTTEAANFGGDIPFFKPTDLDAGDNVRQARENLSEQGLARGRRLAAGSVLVTCIGATIGKTGLAQVACATNQQINAVSPIAGLADSRFIFWWTVSPRGQRQIHSNASATTLPIINKSKFSALAVPLPPLAEQRRIVGEIDRRLSIVREIEAEVDANLRRASSLRSSVLSGVFAVDGLDSISKA